MPNDDNYGVLYLPVDLEPAEGAGKEVPTGRIISRRELLKRAGAGMAADLVSATLGSQRVGALPAGPALLEGRTVPAPDAASGKIPFL